MNPRCFAITCLLALSATPAMSAPSTLDSVRTAGTLACGVVAEPEDWTKSDLHGGLAPLSTEICKAVAVAALGEQAKVDVRPYASELEAGAGLNKGEVALVVGMTPTATAAWHFKIEFGPPIFYDGQSVLVRGDARAEKLTDLAGMRVCFVEGTENERVLLARMAARKIAIIPMPFQEEGEMDDALGARHCDAISAYASKLAVVRAAYPKQLCNDVVLSDWLTLAPVAPAYRQGDAQWAMLVDWTIHALIQAEASGITRETVGAAAHGSDDPIVRRLAGEDWAASRAIGLQDHGWAAKVIAVVGNYGEIYDRTVGAHGALHLPRGRNALWTEGGLMYPLPVQ